jgi:hypothetical protein
MKSLDAWAALHPIVAGIIAIAIIAGCLNYAITLDRENDAALRMQMASGR